MAGKPKPRPIDPYAEALTGDSALKWEPPPAAAAPMSGEKSLLRFQRSRGFSPVCSGTKRRIRREEEETTGDSSTGLTGLKNKGREPSNIAPFTLILSILKIL